VARAEAEGLRRDLERERERAEAAEAAVRRGRVTEIAGEPVDGDVDEGEGDPTARLAPEGDDDRTTRFRTGRDEDQTAQLGTNGTEGSAAPADRPTEVATLERPEPVEGSPGETVRVLGSRRPRRTGEGPPAEAAPGTAAIGARHIEPGQTPQRSALAAWLTRAVAFLALTIVVVAVLMVLKPF
jgi:hypothetical protein